MNCKQQIRDYLAAHRGEIIALMKELVRIPSVRGEAAPGAPFGQACRDVLDFVKDLAEAEGLQAALDAEGGYLLAEYGEGTRSLGLFAHADVVPVGSDWIYTAPFEPLERDGFLIGRGVIDDKAAVVTSLYCVKMLRELKIPFHSRLVLFTGANEESGMQDIKNYLAAHNPPDFSLVCDTAFPLYYGNKGRITFTAASGALSDAFRAFTGGSGGTVIGSAEARLAPDAAMLDWLKSHESADLTVSAEDGEIRLRAVGIARHSALPEGSRNAAGMLASLLADCPMLPESDRAILRFAAAITAAYDGAALGIASDDPPFGRLTCVCTACRLQEHRLTLDFNLRYGGTPRADALCAQINAAMAAAGWTAAAYQIGTPPGYVPPDDAYAAACLAAYREVTGDLQSKPQINAGGTYRAYLAAAGAKAIEIGPTCGGRPPFPMSAGHGHVHQPDECASIDGILRAAEITMQMLLACDALHD